MMHAITILVVYITGLQNNELPHIMTCLQTQETSTYSLLVPIA